MQFRNGSSTRTHMRTTGLTYTLIPEKSTSSHNRRVRELLRCMRY